MFYDYFVDDFTRKFKVTVWSRLCLKIRVYIAQCRFKGIHQWSNFLSQLITAFSDIIREHESQIIGECWEKLENCQTVGVSHVIRR